MISEKVLTFCVTFNKCKIEGVDGGYLQLTGGCDNIVNTSAKSYLTLYAICRFCPFHLNGNDVFNL